MSREFIKNIYLENVSNILERLARYETRQASFAYRRKRHSWLDRGISPSIEKLLLEEALQLLGVPFETLKKRKRSIITVKDASLLRQRLAQLEREDLDNILEHAYRRAVARFWGRPAV